METPRQEFSGGLNFTINQCLSLMDKAAKTLRRAYRL